MSGELRTESKVKANDSKTAVVPTGTTSVINLSVVQPVVEPVIAPVVPVATYLLTPVAPNYWTVLTTATGATTLVNKDAKGNLVLSNYDTSQTKVQATAAYKWAGTQLGLPTK